MPIQFRCTQCDQPIEVDDAYARQAVTCPYCRRVITAPDQSTFSPTAIPTARPSSIDPQAAAAYDVYGNPPPPPRFSVPADNPAVVAAKSYGTGAIICSSLAVVVFLVVVAWAMVIAADFYKEHGASPDAQSAQKYMEEKTNPLLGLAGTCGTLIFASTGLVLSIISLSHSTKGNWRGWTALTLASLILLGFGCMFAASLSSLSQGH